MRSTDRSPVAARRPSPSLSARSGPRRYHAVIPLAVVRNPRRAAGADASRCSPARSFAATNTGVVAGDGTRDFGPARSVERGRDGMRGAGQRAQNEQQAGFVDLSGRSAGACGAGLRRTSRPRSGAAAGRTPRSPRGLTLMSPSSATSRLIVACVVRKPRSRSAAASACWVRIGALVDEVADRSLAELLHHLHGSAPQRRSQKTSTTAASPTITRRRRPVTGRRRKRQHEMDRGEA